MAYPDKYTRQYDFVAYQNANPTRPLPADKVNVDLNAVELSIGEIVDFFKVAVRSDGMMANESIGRDQLTTDLQTLIDGANGNISALAALVAAIVTMTANHVTFTPTGTIAATDVQSALAEHESETTAALALKAPLASPTFTGVPAAPTAAPGTNTTQVSTTGFVKAAIDVVLGGVSASFDTLSEIVAGMQPIDATLTALAGVTTAADKLIYATGSDAFATTDLTAAGRALIDDASAAAQRTTLGVGTADNPQFATIELGAASDTTLARVSAGVVSIEGSNILLASGLGSITQAFDADLSALAANSTDGFWAHTGAGTGAARTFSAGTGITISNPAGIAGNPSFAVDLGKQSVWVPANAITPRTTNGCAALATIEKATNKNLINSLDFDPTTQQFAQFDVRMPKSWNEGTVTFIPVWSHAATSTNFGVVWGLDAVAVSDQDAQDVAFGTAQTSTDTGGTTDTSYQAPESSAVTIAGSPAAGDKVMFRIHRDPANGSDTMAINARLEGILLLYTVDTTKDD